MVKRIILSASSRTEIEKGRRLRRRKIIYWTSENKSHGHMFLQVKVEFPMIVIPAGCAYCNVHPGNDLRSTLHEDFSNSVTTYLRMTSEIFVRHKYFMYVNIYLCS